MAWKTVKEFENLIEFKEDGQKAEGIYQGMREYTNKKGETFNVHTLKIDGVNNQFFGAGMLDHLLSKVDAGKNIRVTYLGKKDSEESKVGFFHDYNVEVEE